MYNLSDLNKLVDESEMILVGIGEEFEECNENVEKAYDVISNLVNNKNYFIVSMCRDVRIFNHNFELDKIVTPFCTDDKYDTNSSEEQWNKYLRWLSFTLNRKLAIIELGVSLNNPGVIRWPFERTASLNNKSSFVRINEILANLPENKAEKSYSVKCNSVEFLLQEI